MDPREPDAGLAPLPQEPIQRLVDPIRRFLHVEAASGIVLLTATVAALVLANSPGAESFLAVWKTKIVVGVGEFRLDHSLRHWINDGLMAVFFYVVGLEVKRELVLGELRDVRRAALPLAAALGGMVVPAGIYLVLQYGEAGEAGWGIPMATDIAFVVGCLAVLGSRVPSSLRILLLSLAIADDIGAILVIAIGYTESLDLRALALGGAGIGIVALCQRLGVRSIGVYAAIGAGIWLAFHESGVHATLAGVILGLQTPARPWVSPGLAGVIVERAGHFLRGDPEESEAPAAPRAVLGHVQTAAREAISPLERLEESLHPWVAFVVMPLFAFANAGVAFRLSDFGDPVATAVGLGLVVGKPAGIVLVSWLAVRAGVASLPDDVGWGLVLAGGCLAGIGFTMSLFIAGLALEGPTLDAAKVGILGGSLVAGVAGMTLLVLLARRPSGSP